MHTHGISNNDQSIHHLGTVQGIPGHLDGAGLLAGLGRSDSGKHPKRASAQRRLSNRSLCIAERAMFRDAGHHPVQRMQRLRQNVGNE